MGRTIFHRELVGHPSRPPACWENQKNKGMRPLLPLHPPNAGLSNQGTERARGWRIRGLDERTDGWEATLRKTNPIKFSKQVQDISKDQLKKKKHHQQHKHCFAFHETFMKQNLGISHSACRGLGASTPEPAEWETSHVEYHFWEHEYRIRLNT